MVANGHYEDISIDPDPIYDTYALMDGTNTSKISGVPSNGDGTRILQKINPSDMAPLLYH